MNLLGSKAFGTERRDRHKDGQGRSYSSLCGRTFSDGGGDLSQDPIDLCFESNRMKRVFENG